MNKADIKMISFCGKMNPNQTTQIVSDQAVDRGFIQTLEEGQWDQGTYPSFENLGLHCNRPVTYNTALSSRLSFSLHCSKALYHRAPAIIVMVEKN